MMRQTGGCAVGEISTRSRFFSRAILSASNGGMMPICSPSSPITRISRARIRSFVRIKRLSIQNLRTLSTPWDKKVYHALKIGQRVGGVLAFISQTGIHDLAIRIHALELAYSQATERRICGFALNNACRLPSNSALNKTSMLKPILMVNIPKAYFFYSTLPIEAACTPA